MHRKIWNLDQLSPWTNIFPLTWWEPHTKAVDTRAVDTKAVDAKAMDTRAEISQKVDNMAAVSYHIINKYSYVHIY